MEHKQLTETEKAQNYLLENENFFESTLNPNLADDLIGVVLYYYQAKGQLERIIQKNKKKFSEEAIDHYKTNSNKLRMIKNEIFKNDLSLSIKKYNESLIMSALVQLIRETEANILLFDDYNQLKEKFYSWPRLGIKHERILLSWKDFSNAIKEIEEYLIEKKNMYFPSIEKLIKIYELNNNVTGKDFYDELEGIPEKQIFYIICNILLTNPILREEILSISLLKDEKLANFERKVIEMLDVLEEKTSDNTLKGLIFLFQKQLNDTRNELL